LAARTIHACSRCGHQSAKWLGRCPECGAWGTFIEEAAAPSRAAPARPPAAPRPLAEIAVSAAQRCPTGLGELDRVLGGGLVAGSVVLVGGEPGIGKSTLLLQAASRLAAAGRGVLYVSGEESAAQIRLRGDRLGAESERLLVAAEIDVDAIVESARAVGPDLLVVDSIQAVRCADLGSLPGSVAQVRDSATRFVELAKGAGPAVLLVGHVTKDGSIAGPRTLEHVVDTVLQFEGDRHHAHRILRALKNRFGPADELGVFRMGERGLVEVPNPSEILLGERAAGAPGSAVLAAMEGSRPLLVEIQALIGQRAQGPPRRTALGLDPNRLAMVLAVLQRRAGLALSEREVFVNVTGGLSVAEPASDLAVAAALASSARGRPLPARWVVLGEIGLTGELRAVSRAEARLREAARLGFEAAVLPARGSEDLRLSGIRAHPAEDLEQALRLLLPREQRQPVDV